MPSGQWDLKLPKIKKKKKSPGSMPLRVFQEILCQLT